MTLHNSRQMICKIIARRWKALMERLACRSTMTRIAAGRTVARHAEVFNPTGSGSPAIREALSSISCCRRSETGRQRNFAASAQRNEPRRQTDNRSDWNDQPCAVSSNRPALFHFRGRRSARCNEEQIILAVMTDAGHRAYRFPRWPRAAAYCASLARIVAGSGIRRSMGDK